MGTLGRKGSMRRRYLARSLATAAVMCTFLRREEVQFLEPSQAPRADLFDAGRRSSWGRRQGAIALAVGLDPSPALASSSGIVRAARASISDCLKNFDDIKSDRASIKGNVGNTMKGFDTVRRYLGTVGEDSPFAPGPGKPGKLESAYRALAEESGDPSVLELAEEITSHLLRADAAANAATRGRSRRCEGGDGKTDACIPKFFEEIRTELAAGLRGFDSLIAVLGE
mmetsp:Transcript_77201/g.136236  ORF Transcript_77201/g.136236 Transcript_77201/m.136236 type:complete len:227 (+) Transcript_77201:51-731(+)